MKRLMRFRVRAASLLLFVLAAFATVGTGGAVLAQEKSAQERIIRDIETRGFTNVTGLRRRGGNYLFQAEDLLGNKVRVVMNAETGEIVGLSRITPAKK
jgi:hypothetical protein